MAFSDEVHEGENKKLSTKSNGHEGNKINNLAQVPNLRKVVLMLGVQ